jgi:hypothetical protein
VRESTVAAYDAIDPELLQDPGALHQAPRFDGVEFKCYSQNSEDGILLYILKAIGGPKSKKALEMCSGDGRENNIINLAINHGFQTLMMDGSPVNAQTAEEFFAQQTFEHRPIFLNQFITKENIVDSVRAQGFTGEIDVLSIDMDGVDYWILKELLGHVFPRLIVVEIQELWGAYEARTRPYRADHVSVDFHEMGASLAAFDVLLRANGYRLVGCIRLGFNAFFVRQGVADHLFQAKGYPVEGCFVHLSGPWQTILHSRLHKALGVDWMRVEQDPQSDMGVRETPVSNENVDPQQVLKVLPFPGCRCGG